MASFILYPAIEPYPTTHLAHTYPEKGHHIPPLSYVAHKVHTKFHNKDIEVHQPRADVRETLHNFYLEIELPGIKDKEALHLRWTTMRTLLVTSQIQRPEIPESDLLEAAPVPAPVPATTTTNGHSAGTEAEPAKEEEGAPAPAPATVKKEPHLTVHERQIGEIERAFHFPIDVDRDNTHAKLDAGILRVTVPKLSEHGAVEEVHLPVQVHA